MASLKFKSGEKLWGMGMGPWIHMDPYESHIGPLRALKGP